LLWFKILRHRAAEFPNRRANFSRDSLVRGNGVRFASDFFPNQLLLGLSNAKFVGRKFSPACLVK